MKKLMFAMAIAASVCFAQADTEIGDTTTFESFDVDAQFNIDATQGDSQWTAPDTEGLVADTKITTYDKDAEDYDAANGDKFLALEGVQNLAKNINTAIGDGLYIDTMVKFTATTDAPTPGDEDKLVVWLKEIEDANGGASAYKLMVTAGYFNSEDIEISAKDYETDAVVVPDRWYNLKVKAIANVDTTGLTENKGLPAFVVFIDGNPVFASGENNLPTDDLEVFGDSKYVTVDDKCALFPSLLEIGGTGNTTITQLVFSGSGAIDTVAAFQGDCDPDDEPTEDWVDPADADAIAAIEGKQVAAVYPSLANTAVATVDAKKLTLWATGTGNVDFSAATGINATAFLLNIANNSSAADIKAAEDTAKEAIKITAISFDENGDVVLAYPATYGNGKIVVEGSLQLPAEWHDKVDTDQFFRTKLVLDEVAAASGE